MSEWRYQIWEFTNARGKSVIHDWLERERITHRERVLLLQKTDDLARHGTTLLTGMLAGPVQSKVDRKIQSHTYKLVVKGDRMLRPMLCKGPFDMENEFTFLLGAIESGGALDHDIAEAERNREILLQDPTRRTLNGRYR